MQADLLFADGKTKAQISCMAMAKLISTFVFAPLTALSHYFLNFKPLAIFCGCTVKFVLDLARYPEDRFSHDAAQMVLQLLFGIK